MSLKKRYDTSRKKRTKKYSQKALWPISKKSKKTEKCSQKALRSF